LRRREWYCRLLCEEAMMMVGEMVEADWARSTVLPATEVRARVAWEKRVANVRIRG
jgi:hypothetical protein